MDGSVDIEEYEKAGGEAKLRLPRPLKVSMRVLPLPLATPDDLAHGDDEFIHILAGVVESESGTDAHLVAERSEEPHV